MTSQNQALVEGMTNNSPESRANGVAKIAQIRAVAPVYWDESISWVLSLEKTK